MNPPRADRTSPSPLPDAWQRPASSLPEGVRVRVLRLVYGDQRAAAELAARLTDRQAAGLDPLPTHPAELAPGLLHGYRGEIRALPDDTRLLLLLAAADQYPVATHAFLRAVAAARLDTRPLETAEAAGLAYATAGGVGFRDAWTRIAAYETAAPADRRDAHRLLARVLHDDTELPRRSWHRGAGALGPSGRLAAELTTAAERARRAADPALACALTERAAALSTDPREQSRLLARAAADAWNSGEADRSRTLAARTDVDALSGVLALRTGQAGEAFDALLAGAVRASGPADMSTTTATPPPRTGTPPTNSPAPPEPPGTPPTRPPAAPEPPGTPPTHPPTAPEPPGSQPEPSGAPTARRPAAPELSGSAAVRRPVVPEPSGAPTVRRPAVPEPPGPVAVRPPAPPEPASPGSVRRPVVPEPSGSASVSPPAPPEPPGPATIRPQVPPEPSGPVAVRHPAVSEAVGPAAGGRAVAPSPPVVELLLARATEAAVYTGDLRRCREAVRVARRLGVAPPGVLAGVAAAVDGRYGDARDLLEATAGRCGPGGDPTLLLHAGIAALMLGDHTRAATATLRAAAAARARGLTATVSQAMEFRAYTDFWTGRPRAAETAALDALRQAYATGQDNGACHLQAALAMFAALTGDGDLCRERAAAARSYALAHGLGLPAALAQWALALLDLGAGRYAAAAARLRALAALGPGHGHRAVRHLATPHYVEAAVRAGDTRMARAAHADYDRWARAVRSPDDLALSARCRALLTPGADAVEHYRTALDLHADGTRAFERARTELLFGSALRRLRRRAEARDRLHSAREAFESFGAPHCAEAARAELRALGAPATPAHGADTPTARLTAQQLMVARMAAEGATNREIAARLALSPRTIDHHLRGVFTRLGIRSRIELVRLLAETD